jgi:hypothetical protein
MHKLIKKKTLVGLYFIEIYKYICLTVLFLVVNFFIIELYESTFIELINAVFFEFLLMFGFLDYEIIYNNFEYSLNECQYYLIVSNSLIQLSLVTLFIGLPASKYSLLKNIFQGYVLLSFFLIALGALFAYMGSNLYFYFAYLVILNDNFDPAITFNDFSNLLKILFTIGFELFCFFMGLKIIFSAKISVKLMRILTFYLLLSFLIISFKNYLFEDLIFLTTLLLVYREFQIISKLK